MNAEEPPYAGKKLVNDKILYVLDSEGGVVTLNSSEQSWLQACMTACRLV